MTKVRINLLSSWWGKKEKSLSHPNKNSSGLFFLYYCIDLQCTKLLLKQIYLCHTVDRRGHARRQIHFPPRVLLAQYCLDKNRALSISLYYLKLKKSVFILSFASIFKMYLFFGGRGASLAFVCCFSHILL